MTNSPFIALRDTISKQVTEYPAAEAEKWLGHPVFGLRLEKVDIAKPEVLGQPFIFDSEGNKHAIEGEAPVEEVSTEDDLVIDYESFSKADLVSEIEARNEGRDEADIIDNSGVKADLIAALIADDEKVID